MGIIETCLMADYHRLDPISGISKHGVYDSRQQHNKLIEHLAALVHIKID